MNRRDLLLAGLSYAATCVSISRAQAQDANQNFVDTVESIRSDAQATDDARRIVDFAQDNTSASCDTVNINGISQCIISAARGPPHLKPSTLRISNRAISLIVACEVSSQQHYTRALERPTWPRLQSGITIGIGYDLGQVTVDDFVDDWSKYVHPFVIETLSPVTGLQGAAARDKLQEVQIVGIKWPDAYKQFVETTLPLFTAETERFCRNLAVLSDDSRGALVSLILNRGSAKTLGNDPNDRRKEMRTIALLMKEERYSEIPAQFIAMRRLWENNKDARGLVARRLAEAQLFQLGLDSQ
jgi:GH24 family phage-related lysozyme (muramidase)